MFVVPKGICVFVQTREECRRRASTARLLLQPLEHHVISEQLAAICLGNAFPNRRSKAGGLIDQPQRRVLDQAFRIRTGTGGNLRELCFMFQRKMNFPDFTVGTTSLPVNESWLLNPAHSFFSGRGAIHFFANNRFACCFTLLWRAMNLRGTMRF